MNNTTYVIPTTPKHKKLNIYKVTRADGSWEYRAGTWENIQTIRFTPERLERIDVVQREVSIKEIYNHMLPIVICV